MNNCIVETDREKRLTNRKLKEECFQYARKNYQGRLFKNSDTGRYILVSRDGLDKWFNMTKSREQCLSIKKLDTILQECKKVGSYNDNKKRHGVDGFTYFNYEMKINNKPYKVNIATKETHSKDSKYYYHFLEDIKIEPDSGLA